ncbi:MAG: Hsp33 family molecular chaperone HslO, partial [Vulcanimicrobiaceae bacterium]
LLDALAGDFDLRTYHEIDVTLACLCTRAKVEVALLGLGAEELGELIRERPVTEATCEFCKATYEFDASQMRELVERL